MVPDPNNETRFIETDPNSEFVPDDEGFMDTLDITVPRFPKEQQDIAAAVVSLRQGFVSERKLLEAIRSWTIHGSVPLLDHLVEIGLIDDVARQELATQVNTVLTELTNNGPLGSTNESLIAGTLEALDPLDASPA